MNVLVLDASTAISFLLEDEFSPAAIRALGPMRATGVLVVPGHFWIEITNALLMTERRRQASRVEVTEALRLASVLPLTTDLESAARSSRETLDLARTYALTVYDAAYLEPSIRANAALATVDRALARAARAVGVELLI